jgi:hypothetical protein
MLISEFESLSYKESQMGINNAQIDDTRDKNGHYDLHAALRYAAVSENCAITYMTVPNLSNKTSEQLLEEDLKIKNQFKDESARKKLELEADLKLIKEDPRQWG